jgi:hypothetical protein
MYPNLTSQLADERLREMRRSAQTQRFAALQLRRARRTR